jgi:hypothetical protein
MRKALIASYIALVAVVLFLPRVGVHDAIRGGWQTVFSGSRFSREGV